MDNNVQNSNKQNLIIVFLIFMSVVTACTSPNPPTFHLVPAPVEMKIMAGYYPLDSVKCIVKGIDAIVEKKIDTTLTELGSEGYLLQVTSSAIKLTASTIRGIFYGKQTILQLMTANGIPCVEIKDYPRFSYRGIHLDVSRHFFPKEQVLKYLMKWLIIS